MRTSIDSFAPANSPLRGFVHVANASPARASRRFHSRRERIYEMEELGSQPKMRVRKFKVAFKTKKLFR